MEIDPAIFRAYDIRGKVSESLSPDIVKRIGKAFGTYIKGGGGNNVSVSRDNRKSSKDLASEFIRGVLSTGVNVVDLSLSTTPMLYFSIIHHNFDGGAIITGSHNTPDYNGVKLCKHKALHIFGDELKIVQTIADSQDFSCGKGQLIKKDIHDEYEKEILDRISLEQTIKIAIDCGDGVSSLFAPRIFERMGCRIVLHACRPHGGFPHGSADPSEPQNLSDLARVVTKNKADLGIGLDPDADRLGVVDEKGNYAPIEAVAALIAQDILPSDKFILVEPGSWTDKNERRGIRFVYDIKSLLGFKKVVEKFGGRTEILPTGRSYFRQKLFEDPRIALGVEASGHIHINDNFYGFDDAIFSAGRLLEILSRSGQALSDLLADFPKSFYTPAIKPNCPDDRKFVIVEEVKKELAKKYDTIDIDGVKFFLDKDSWGLVRASNTGPHLSLRFEADTKGKFLRMIDVVAEQLKKYPEVDQDWTVLAKGSVL